MKSATRTTSSTEKKDKLAPSVQALLDIQPKAQRGSLVRLKSPLNDTSDLAIIVSNDIQNQSSDFLLAVPLERRISRLKAPFSVDLGRSDGMRDLHTARCDWVSRINQSEIASIERARFPEALLDRLEEALKVALGFSEVI